MSDDPAFRLDEGAQVVAEAAPVIGTPALGHVTSSYFSPTLGRTFAMALVAAGRSRIGASLHVTTMQGTASARIVEPIFYDKEGKRLDG
jgi:sarcosine oxidase subunit alpha